MNRKNDSVEMQGNKKQNNKKDDVLYYSARFSIPQTASILGVGPDTVRLEIKDGNLNAELRRKRKKCSQAAIDTYIKNREICAAKEESYVYKHMDY